MFGLRARSCRQPGESARSLLPSSADLAEQTEISGDPKLARDGPRWPQQTPKIAPRPSQDHPKTARDSPRTPQDRSLQDHPETDPDRPEQPKSPKSRPKTTQEPHKTHPRAFHFHSFSFAFDFLSLAAAIEWRGPWEYQALLGV